MVARKHRLLRFYLLVLCTGIAAGIGAIIFRELIGFFHNFFFLGQFSFYYDTLQHTPPSPWGAAVILVPVVGAACVAYLVKNHAPEARGSGVPEVLYAIYYERGIIRPIVAVVRALASSISIGSGASVGREGPIIQIGAAVGATLGQYIKMTEGERIILIACGAGGGIAASFNIPFTGILFALEIMLPKISMKAILPISMATALATYTSFLYFGNVTFMPIISQAVIQLNFINSIFYILFSIILGLCSAFFIRGLYFAENQFARWQQNYYVKHMLAMLVVGLSMYAMMYAFGHYYVQGLGYATVYDVLLATLTHPGFLLFLAALKTVDTFISLGSGASGGIFSPLVFIGAALGGSFAGATHYFFPDSVAINLQLSVLAGIAGMIGASCAAPIMAIMMAAELTNDFSVILPLIVLVVIASGVRHALVKDSVFTFGLAGR